MNTTRRSVLMGLTGSLARPRFSSPAERDGAGGDRALLLWMKWQTARDEDVRCRAKRDGLEADLVAAIDYPRVFVAKRGQSQTGPVYASDEETIRMLVRSADRRERLIARLRQHQETWRERAEAIGLLAAERAEANAAEHLDLLTEQLGREPASTLAGITAKLFVAVDRGEAGPFECDSLPWLHLRSALADLINMLDDAPARRWEQTGS